MHPKPAGPATGPSVSAPSHNCCNTGHGSLCENACRTGAVALTAGLVFRIAPVARTVAEAPCPGLSLFAQGIDHVPLA